MTPSLTSVIEKIAWDHHRGRPLTLFFDYDGTLTPIVEHPSLATLDRAMRRLLVRLARRTGVHVAIVSGRSLKDLQTMVPSRHLYYAGTGGIELDLRGRRVVHPLAGRTAAALAELAVDLREAAADFPGAWVEEKPLGCTVHYRAVAAPLIDAFCANFHRAVARCAAPLVVLDGRMAFEITPDVGWNKASAVRQILEHLHAVDPIVLYAGDAENDAVALAAVTAMGGISLGIGPQSPVAGFRLASPAALSELLLSLDESLNRAWPCHARTVDEHSSMHRVGETGLPTRC